ncbi:MAG: hypothetical protein JO122_13350 [Acetobacteraceae bacterium]|nr:hypothetical protein [Acetobacteraceae bacterium]
MLGLLLSRGCLLSSGLDFRIPACQVAADLVQLTLQLTHLLFDRIDPFVGILPSTGLLSM